jgi:hypothetical protein
MPVRRELPDQPKVRLNQCSDIFHAQRAIVPHASVANVRSCDINQVREFLIKLHALLPRSRWVWKRCQGDLLPDNRANLSVSFLG